jgi:GNAT superfamily N-acetyltransferase
METRMTIKIRDARTYDAAAIAALATELGYPATRQAIAVRLAGIEAEPHSRVFVAENVDGEVIAWLHVAVRAQLTEDSSAEILGLVVADGERSFGIGAALLGVAESWARQLGCAQVRVRSRVERERAHAFYRRAGFARVKTQAVLAKPLS